MVPVVDVIRRDESRRKLNLYFFSICDTLFKPVLGGTTTRRTPFRFCHPPTVVGGKELVLGNPDEHTIL